VSAPDDIRTIQLGEGQQMKLRVGEQFILAEIGFLQGALTGKAARKVGQELIAAADRLETRQVISGSQMDG
jgi:hypothetical protein